MKSMNGSRRNLKLFLLFNQLSTRTLMCNSSKNWALQVSTGTEGKLTWFGNPLARSVAYFCA